MQRTHYTLVSYLTKLLLKTSRVSDAVSRDGGSWPCTCKRRRTISTPWAETCQAPPQFFQNRLNIRLVTFVSTRWFDGSNNHLTNMHFDFNRNFFVVKSNKTIFQGGDALNFIFPFSINCPNLAIDTSWFLFIDEFMFLEKVSPNIVDFRCMIFQSRRVLR